MSIVDCSRAGTDITAWLVSMHSWVDCVELLNSTAMNHCNQSAMSIFTSDY